jgi:hypothetical protein
MIFSRETLRLLLAIGVFDLLGGDHTECDFFAKCRFVKLFRLLGERLLSSLSITCRPFIDIILFGRLDALLLLLDRDSFGDGVLDISTASDDLPIPIHNELY